jgi:hypothetical protein
MSDERTIATTIRVPGRVWSALRQIAEQRALADGGRPSLSAVVAELVEREVSRREAAAPRG